MAKSSTAATLLSLDDYPTIEEWMVHGEKPWPKITDLCPSESTEIRCSDSTVAQLTWIKHGGAAFFRDGQGL
jgi:hypothetical protein